MIRVIAIASFLFLICVAVFAEQRPFLYTVTLPDGNSGKTVVHFDAGFGSGSLGPPEAAFIDRRIGMSWRAGSQWTLVATGGMGEKADSKSSYSGQAELFFSIPIKSHFHLEIGEGMRWESAEGGVAMLHVISGWKSARWMLESNFILEKASSSNRDPVDLITSIGWMRRVSSHISLGVEAVGQDLEGFWEANEAEGGARILTGPSAHLQVGAWEAGVAGGYIFRPTNSGRTSAADRVLGSNRLAIQISLSRAF